MTFETRFHSLPYQLQESYYPFEANEDNESYSVCFHTNHDHIHSFSLEVQIE